MWRIPGIISVHPYNPFGAGPIRRTMEEKPMIFIVSS